MAIDVTVQDDSSGIDVTVTGGADTRVNVSNGGTTVVTDATDIDAGAGLTATDDGDGSATMATSGDQTFSSVTTDAQFNSDNPITARVFKDGSTYRAHGRSGEIATGSDAAAVINASIDAVADTDTPGTGQTISIARGRYECGETISLDDGVSLVGEGMRATVLDAADGLNANLIEYVAGDAADDRDYFSGLFDLKLLGNKANNTSGHGVLVDNPNSQQPNDWHMERVFVHKFADDGLRFNYAWGVHIDHVLSETNGRDGIYIRGNQSYIDNVFTAYNEAVGIDIGTEEAHVSNIRCHGNGLHGIILSIALRNTLTNIIATNNNQDNLGQTGIYLNTDDCTASNLVAVDTQGTPTQARGVRVSGSDLSVGPIYTANNTTADLQVNSDSADAKVWGVWGSLTDDGTRTVLNGWGENAGDPTSTGDWNGNGYEGAAVVDTTNTVKYAYRGGAWV